jgi:hypothetical protein
MVELHAVSHEEGSFWEVTVSDIIRKKVYMYMCKKVKFSPLQALEALRVVRG